MITENGPMTGKEGLQTHKNTNKIGKIIELPVSRPEAGHQILYLMSYDLNHNYVYLTVIVLFLYKNQKLYI